MAEKGACFLMKKKRERRRRRVGGVRVGVGRADIEDVSDAVYLRRRRATRVDKENLHEAVTCACMTCLLRSPSSTVTLEVEMLRDSTDRPSDVHPPIFSSNLHLHGITVSRELGVYYKLLGVAVCARF